MNYQDEYLFAGAGMSSEEIEKVLSAHDKESRVRELRTCRLRLIGEVHEKQQELDRLDYLIGRILSEQVRGLKETGGRAARMDQRLEIKQRKNGWRQVRKIL